MAEYRQLQRTDLITFDQEATGLVIEAGENGWLGRISNKGHAILRAPDGQTTLSISRDSLRGRSGRNARAQFERWRREHVPTEEEWPPAEKEARVGPEHVEAALKETPDPDAFICSVCGKEYADAPSLGSHKRAHALASRPLVTCPVCGGRYSVFRMHLRVHGEKAVAAYAEGGMRRLRRHVKQESGTVADVQPEPVKVKQEAVRPDESWPTPPPSTASGVALDAVRALVAENARLHEENETLQTRLELIKESVNL